MTTPPDTPAAPRDAASLVLTRRGSDGSVQVLMGQRGAAARFMPSKFVFPGGALDADDAHDPGGAPLAPACLRRLARHSPPDLGPALARAAVRETFEEAGLALGAPDPAAASAAAAAPGGWRGFLGMGLAPALDRLTFFFRAVTPPSRPLRFDARFFLADAEALTGDPDDFSRAEAELSHLQWITLAQARALDLPFVTAMVLAEVALRVDAPDPARPAPFFHHRVGRPFIDALE